MLELNGEVPETLISGETSDISHFCGLGWYQWIKFREIGPHHKFPEEHYVLGRWLGPATDVGPAMASKILKENGKVIIRSTYRPLTQDELNNPDELKERNAFPTAINAEFGPCLLYTSPSPRDQRGSRMPSSA